ncbi:hypothetical protein A4R26_14460 [Niastella populi]|uniref:Uncharacterized protein n=1 Tax=Niastella populi TaxID=550983 RepID=A0A1V9G550_9BACT|nr:hypothetical protein A4R26_14460 [Niastella populi]
MQDVFSWLPVYCKLVGLFVAEFATPSFLQFEKIVSKETIFNLFFTVARGEKVKGISEGSLLLNRV